MQTMRLKMRKTYLLIGRAHLSDIHVISNSILARQRGKTTMQTSLGGYLNGFAKVMRLNT